MTDPSQECLKTRRQVDLKTSYKKEVQEDHKNRYQKRNWQWPPSTRPPWRARSWQYWTSRRTR